MTILLEDLGECIQFFLDVTSEPTIIIDLKGEIHERNDPFNNLLGDSQITNFKEILDFKSTEKFKEFLRDTPSQKKVTDCFLLKVKNGEMVSIPVHLFFDEKTKYAILLLSTVSSQNDYVFQGKSKKSEIEQVAASVVHEIRNPLTTLKGFTQLMRKQSTEDIVQYLNVIDNEIVRMEQILGEMLTLCKPVQMNKKTISLPQLIEDVIQIIRPKAIVENVEIVQKNEYRNPPIILGDPYKLKQLFLNLFKNSFESMALGGKITIKIESFQNNLVTVIIKDTGRGIPANQLQKIFMPYFTTKSSGTRLGMPFVLETVEEHDGTIAVSSEVNRWTSFILTFPIYCE